MLTIGPKQFEWDTRTYLMGILNATPDSFSGDGLLAHSTQVVEQAVLQAGRFLEAGADILDVGGESTRPGAENVSAAEECARVLPIIRALAKAYPEVALSIDTYKASVAQAALEAGAHLVNDVWGLRADPQMGAVVASASAPVVLMHNRSKPGNAQVQARLGGRYVGVEYANLFEDVKRELLESVCLAHEAGIPDEHIILDPGIGFGKTVQQNLALLDHLDVLKSLGYPILLGTSRKSFIGYTLDLPPNERVEGTATTVAIGIARGADIVRVHDLEVMARTARMADAIVRH